MTPVATHLGEVQFMAILVFASLSVAAVFAISNSNIRSQIEKQQQQQLPPSSQQQDYLHMAFISDFHLDLFYGTDKSYGRCTGDVSTKTLGQFHCDSPLLLASSAAKDVQEVTKPEFIVVGGDWLRHKSGRLSEDDNAKVFKTVTGLFSGYNGSMLPMPNFATPLGNNDFVPDYNFNITSPEPPKLLVNMSKTLVEEKLLTKAEHETFHKYGYYKRQIVVEQLKSAHRQRHHQKATGEEPPVSSSTRLNIIVLNTLIWTYNLSPKMATTEDPLGQFEFLQAALDEAQSNGEAVWILSHIPPGINIFNVESDPKTMTRNNTSSHYWQTRYENKYFTIVQNYSDTIKAQIFAHTHHFSFSGDELTGVPLFILGAISPIYFNLPSYMIVKVDPVNFEIHELTQRALNITDPSTKPNDWVTGMSFTEVYNTTKARLHQKKTKAAAAGRSSLISADYLHNIAEQIGSNWTAYQTFRKMNSGGDILDSFGNSVAQSIISCVGKRQSTERFFDCFDAAKTERKKL